MWFGETDGRIGRLTPLGVYSEYPIPGGGLAWDIVVGPDGALWFTELNSTIHRLTTSGAFSEFEIPSGRAAFYLSLIHI